jgi:hypothetical protein
MVYFHTKKSKFGYIYEGLGMENVGECFGYLEYIIAFGIFYTRWVILW